MHPAAILLSGHRYKTLEEKGKRPMRNYQGIPGLCRAFCRHAGRDFSPLPERVEENATAICAIAE
jgi:hypothetical protein